MQIRFTLPLSKATGVGFKNSLSAVLSGLTIAGAFSTVIFNSGIANEKVIEATQQLNNLLKSSFLYEGIKHVVGTLKEWGTTVINAKDDFKNWVERYLGPSGFKSGVVQLYEKLKEWSLIVYNWFKERFIEFISNIPKMVEHWRKLRLSLFKWGTFLGGGGGSALWSMFGSGDNWGKLSALMGHPNFEEMMNDFNTLVQENPDAFEKMGAEGIEEIIKEYLDDPEKAKQDAKELIKEQEEKKKKAEEENKAEEEGQLTAEEIREKFSEQKGGKPKNTEEALWGLMGAGLKPLLSIKDTDSPYAKAKEAMEEHFKHLENEAKRGGKIAEIKKELVEQINSSKQKEDLIRAFAGLASKAYSAYNSIEDKKNKPEMLGKFFEEYFKEEYTREGGGDEEGIQIDGKIQLKK